MLKVTFVKDDTPEDDTLPYVIVEELADTPDIAAMSAKDAKEWIAECGDPKMLSIIIGTDDRSTIVKAIDNRLAELEDY